MLNISLQLENVWSYTNAMTLFNEYDENNSDDDIRYNNSCSYSSEKRIIGENYKSLGEI